MRFRHCLVCTLPFPVTCARLALTFEMGRGPANENTISTLPTPFQLFIAISDTVFASCETRHGTNQREVRDTHGRSPSSGDPSGEGATGKHATRNGIPVDRRTTPTGALREHVYAARAAPYEGWKRGGVNLVQVPSKHETRCLLQQGRKAMTGLMRVPPHHLVRRALRRKREGRLVMVGAACLVAVAEQQKSSLRTMANSNSS